MERLLQAAEEGGRMGSVIEILVLQALAHEAQGNIPLSLVPLERALTLAEPEGYVRIFVDEGETLRILFRHAAAGGIVSSYYVSKLLEAFNPIQGEDGATKVEKLGALPIQPESVDRQSLPEPLNERELAILKFMAAGLSNREIANELYISVNTVRWHAHNLFGKLGVDGRSKAVSLARDLNLL